MKRIVFLVIATLLVMGLVLPGCGGGGDGGDGGNGGPDTRPPITIAIAEAMTDVTGKDAIAGAEMARDEINAGAGVNVGGTYHKIALVSVDTNEVSGNPDEAINALQAVIDDVDLVIGGFRTEKVTVYREVAMDAEKLFMIDGAATGSLQLDTMNNYDKYKYSFRTATYNENFLCQSCFRMMKYFAGLLKDKLIAEGGAVKADYTVPDDGKLRMAILAENAAWCNGLVSIMQAQATSAGFTLVGTWLVSPTATDISTELTQIETKKPHFIIDVFSGPVGVVYPVQKDALGIPAMTIGINVPIQVKSAWTTTSGTINNQVLLDTWAEGVQNTAKTKAFFDAFMAKTGEYPGYTASSYDTINQLKVAIEAVSAAHHWTKIADVVKPANIDALIQYLEDPSHAYTGTAATNTWYPKGTIPASTTSGPGYDLDAAQVSALYNLASYGWTYVQAQWLGGPSAMLGPHIQHDMVYGVGYATGIGSQWQDGHKVGIFPVNRGAAYDAAMTDQYGNWNFAYPGTKTVVIPIAGFLAS
ncbi:MAG: ABC transporter substrate-binding protein [Dehalococcoidia bacterium]